MPNISWKLFGSLYIVIENNTHELRKPNSSDSYVEERMRVITADWANKKIGRKHASGILECIWLHSSVYGTHYYVVGAHKCFLSIRALPSNSNKLWWAYEGKKSFIYNAFNRFTNINFCFAYIYLDFFAYVVLLSGIWSRTGSIENDKKCLLYGKDDLKSLSVPWRLSRIPNTP